MWWEKVSSEVTLQCCSVSVSGVVGSVLHKVIVSPLFFAALTDYLRIIFICVFRDISLPLQLGKIALLKFDPQSYKY